MTALVEIELKFLLPAARRAALAVELTGRGTAQRTLLQDIYLDTPDLHLARAGLAWRLRREGGRWVQALKAARAGALERFEHEVELSDANADAQAHADTAPGRELLALLAAAHKQGHAPTPCFSTRVLRLTRRVRTRGAVVDVMLDEGRVQAGGRELRLREVEFELVSGSPLALLALAERWRARFGLVLDPRNKAERGFALATGAPDAPLRKAATPRYAQGATVTAAFGAVLDECLAHLGRNAIALASPAAGDPTARGAHVHQARVAIRRLRSALSAFRDGVAAPPPELVDGLRALFATLGESRDRDVLDSGVAADLARAGAPPLPLPLPMAPTDPAALMREAATQRLLLDWLRWRTALSDDDAPPDLSLKRLARRRLRRWHRALATTCRAFEELDDEALHELRKRVKRQRYALELFAPLQPADRLKPYRRGLAAAQQALGEINDLVVARTAYQALVAADPAAWFAVGWLTARLAEARRRAREALGRLAMHPAPVR
ncbi:CHAD domain-containing protein [Roseateles sp. DC23W]|uniref:CHAD domain-containing protein n=1 Tax=Pelomonas dachongensis TaxID=3299029 RepID=A0ABW7EH20_9BURK